MERCGEEMVGKESNNYKGSGVGIRSVCLKHQRSFNLRTIENGEGGSYCVWNRKCKGKGHTR